MNSLTESKLQEILDEASRINEENPPTFVIGKKQLALLKAKYPETYDKPYKCSWEKLGEELGIESKT